MLFENLCIDSGTSKQTNSCNHVFICFDGLIHLSVSAGCLSHVVGVNWTSVVFGSRASSLCLHQTEQNVPFGRADEASATRGRVVRAHKTGVGVGAREQEAVN